MNVRKAIIALMLFTLICVSSVGASGIVKFHIPEISNAAVGDTVDATLYVDNNLNPLSSDIALNLDWNNEILKYVGTDFSAGHSNDAELIGTHQLTLDIADHTNGIAAGDVPAAHMKFKVVGPGTSPIVIKINKVTDLSGADIISKAVAKDGQVTATGTASATTTPTTTETTATVTSVQVVNPSPATVPANTGVFAISSVGNVGVGQTASATLYVNNAWNPRFGDTYIDVTWDPSVAEYVSTDIRVSSNTTGAEGGAGHVRIALGDFRNGYPTGSYPIATINLKALKAGTTPLTVSIDHVRYWSSDLTTFTDITSSARALSGTFSTGALSGAVLDPGYAYEIGSVQSGGWQTYTMDVRSSDDYDILALVYSQANDFDLYISDPLTGAVYTAATAPYSTENGLTYIWAVSTIKPGKYLVSIHSTSGTGNFAFIHFYNRQPTQRAAT